MNINKNKKILWLAPELTNSDLIYNLFFESGFEKLDKLRTTNNKLEYSQDDYIESEFGDYEIVCSVRNPYDRMVQIFLEYEIKPSIPITKDLEPKLILLFQRWIESIFERKKIVVSVNDWGKDVLISKVIKKFLFRQKLPNRVIRYEHMIDDLETLRFMIPIYDLQKKRELQEKISFVPNGVKFNYKNFYTVQTAKIIYNYYFNHFHLAEYDPFSFTDTDLTVQEKNKFLHDTF